MAIREAPGVDLWTRNLPGSKEVAAILPDDNVGAKWDIILHRRIRGLERISDRPPAYDPLHFRLLFPHGDLGWYLAVLYQSDATRRNN